MLQASRYIAALVAAAAVSGCATARNYDDPLGPLYLGPQTAITRSASDLRVVSFNTKFAEHLDRAATLLTAKGPLRDADVLVLQEMDLPGTTWMASQLGMNYVYIPAVVHPVSKHDFGVAILSPWTLTDPQKILLPHPHRFRKMRRVAAAATVSTPSGAVRVFSVHLETPFGASGGSRRDQARTVADEAAAWAGPVVIAGDFNGATGARELERLGFTWLTRNVHNTSGPFDFDHMLVRGLCATSQPPAGKAPDSADASDHVPLWTTVRQCRPSSSAD